MSDLISRESLKQRINLNYNNRQYIDTQSIKDIIDTEPSVEDKTVEELEKIIDKIDFEEKRLINIKTENGFIPMIDISNSMYRIRRTISELKGENKK